MRGIVGDKVDGLGEEEDILNANTKHDNPRKVVVRGRASTRRLSILVPKPPFVLETCFQRTATVEEVIGFDHISVCAQFHQVKQVQWVPQAHGKVVCHARAPYIVAIVGQQCVFSNLPIPQHFISCIFVPIYHKQALGMHYTPLQTIAEEQRSGTSKYPKILSFNSRGSISNVVSPSPGWTETRL